LGKKCKHGVTTHTGAAGRPEEDRNPQQGLGDELSQDIGLQCMCSHPVCLCSIHRTLPGV